ncbi:hypothetical protein [Chryseobacterium mulctrae]|uniref:hypothetical protein n=1 Tax=Chryseobacterium mulctrae TaxID=2576777 RepID=UPI00111692BF|nr:hypothetical protein [Chryseobacterium mulctrae]
MNTTVRTHAKNISDLAKSNKGFLVDGLPFEGMGIQARHNFKLTNDKNEIATYLCAVRNIEMALDILEVAHELMESTFERDFFKKHFESQDIDLDLAICLCYYKSPVIG